MLSPLGNIRNVKIFVLYLMQNVGYPMDYITVSEIIMQTDYVAYLDFAESFAQMEDGGLIEKVGMNEQGEATYAVTKQGATVAETLHSDILSSILEESLASALRLLDFRKRGVKTSCKSTKNPSGGYDLHCTLTEGDKTLLSLTLWVDSDVRAEAMKERFRQNPEHLYRASYALLSGNVSYLFNS